jgi:hypothetical protein
MNFPELSASDLAKRTTAANEILLATNEATVAAGAKRVLGMMDGVEDGDGRYQEFVAIVSKETGTSIHDLNDELEKFI